MLSDQFASFGYYLYILYKFILLQQVRLFTWSRLSAELH